MPNININGIDLWFQRAGKGFPVIFLHAFAVSSASWLPQISVLTSAGYDVISVDQRGHGRSSAPVGPYSIPQMAEDIHQTILQLGMERICVVGISMGGRVALRLALDYPQDVGMLALVSAKSEPAREIQTQLDTLAQSAEQGEVAAVIDEWYTERYYKLAACAPDLIQKLKAEWRGKSGNGFAGAARALIGMKSMTSRIVEIQIPTLAIAGALDTPCHPYLAWYERSIPGCRGFIVPDTHHFVNIEQAEHFNTLLLTFLNENVNLSNIHIIGSNQNVSIS